MKMVSQKLVVLLLAALTAGLAVGTVDVAWRLHCEAKARHHNNLGVALMDPDAANDVDFDGAIREFETALRIWPRYHLARVNLGIALFRAEKEDRAMDVLQEACRGDPGDLRVQYSFA